MLALIRAKTAPLFRKDRLSSERSNEVASRWTKIMTNDPIFRDEERARELWQEGVQELIVGRIQSAVDCFNQSLSSCPTAEGYTYRGWAVSFLGMLEQAVEDCRKAIRVDPEFGNPYNDIGVYMMQLGLLDEAIPWLESAKRAKRYEP